MANSATTPAAKPEATLKSRSLVMLIGILASEITLLVAMAGHASWADWTNGRYLALRTALVAGMTLPVLLLTYLLPSIGKEVLVFWRWPNPLPGTRAFSVHAENDPRIDIERLRQRVGPFPIEPRAQNSRWYGLYREVRHAPEVRGDLGQYLLFRDLAAVSILLTLAVPIVAVIDGMPIALAAGSGLCFFMQYLLTARAGSVAATRMVCHVLALYASTPNDPPTTPGAKPVARSRARPQTQQVDR